MAAMASLPSFLSTRILSASPPTHCRLTSNALNRPSSSLRASLSSDLLAPFVGVSVCSDFCGHKIRPQSLNPATSSTSRPTRSVVTMVLPSTGGEARGNPPPDLASFLFERRIVSLGMPLFPAVTRLLIAQLLCLQMQDEEKPVYLYIDSTGIGKGGKMLGHETDAFAIYDVMRYVAPPIFTLAVGNAWGEAALLLAAGVKGNRAALPAASIMIRQPMARFSGQTTAVNRANKEMDALKAELVNLYSIHTGKSPEVIEADIRCPKYFSPSEAVEYGIIDKVLYTERSKDDMVFMEDLKKA